MNQQRQMPCIFVSYAHADGEACSALLQALRSHEKASSVTVWHDHALVPGEDYLEVILKRLGRSEVVLLLVSERFIASQATSVEVSYAMAKQEKGTSYVVPILLEDCIWQSEPYASLQSLPRPLVPMNAQLDVAEAWHGVAEDILRLCEDLGKPQQNEMLALFSDGDLIEMIEEVDKALAVIHRAHVRISPDLRALQELAMLEEKRASYKQELAARIGAF